jgi:hypothetical protein
LKQENKILCPAHLEPQESIVAVESDSKNQFKVALLGGIAVVMLLSAIFAAFE